LPHWLRKKKAASDFFVPIFLRKYLSITLTSPQHLAVVKIEDYNLKESNDYAQAYRRVFLITVLQYQRRTLIEE
jgi:hypothetical protein